MKLLVTIPFNLMFSEISWKIYTKIYLFGRLSRWNKDLAKMYIFFEFEILFDCLGGCIVYSFLSLSLERLLLCSIKVLHLSGFSFTHLLKYRCQIWKAEIIPFGKCISHIFLAANRSPKALKLGVIHTEISAIIHFIGSNCSSECLK